MTLLELLQAGQVDEFNARRGQRVTLDLFAADLSGLSLAGVDLSNANLEKADLSGTDLSGANLTRTNLCGADLTAARLERAVGVRAKLREAYLGEAVATGAEFGFADFTEADLSSFDGTGGHFAGARFKDAVMSNARLTGADLSEARLSGADLRGADLTGARLAQAELLRTNASGACLERCDLHDARLAGAVFRGTRMAGVDLSGADLSGADLTGAELAGANLERADLFEVQAEAETLRAAKLPAGWADGTPPLADAGEPVELHFDDPSVAAVGDTVAVLWENAEPDESFRLRVAVCGPRGFDGTSQAIALALEQVKASALLPLAGRYACAFFVDRPAGMELVVMELDTSGTFSAPRSVRIGYTPVVKPVLVPEDDGFLLYGIGRQGALSVHRFDGAGLTELMRAPANTYRGFCGRLDPILLGKGGTVAAVRRDGIGRLLTAPSGYPGRLTAAAYRAEGEQIALLWAARGEKGLRFQVLGADGEATRLDTASDVGALDLIAVEDRWLAVWTRESAKERDHTLPVAQWLPGGKPFVLLAGKDRVDVEDIRFLPGGAPPRVALITIGEDLVVLEIEEDGARRLATFSG